MSSSRLVRGIGVVVLATLATGCAKTSDDPDEFRPNQVRPKQIEEMRQKQLKDRTKDAPPKP